MLIFDVWHWDTEKPHSSELCVSFCLDPIATIWQRIAHAFRYVFTGKTVKWWWADTVVPDADVVRLRDYLNAYLATSLNGAAK
jgi:hypothetical protein